MPEGMEVFPVPVLQVQTGKEAPPPLRKGVAALAAILLVRKEGEQLARPFPLPGEVEEAQLQQTGMQRDLADGGPVLHPAACGHLGADMDEPDTGLLPHVLPVELGQFFYAGTRVQGQQDEPPVVKELGLAGIEPPHSAAAVRMVQAGALEDDGQVLLGEGQDGHVSSSVVLLAARTPVQGLTSTSPLFTA